MLRTFRGECLASECLCKIGYADGSDYKVAVGWREDTRFITLPNVLVTTTFSIPALRASRRMRRVPSFAVCSGSDIERQMII
jgi:hypothetical protein